MGAGSVFEIRLSASWIQLQPIVFLHSLFDDTIGIIQTFILGHIWFVNDPTAIPHIFRRRAKSKPLKGLSTPSDRRI